MVQKISIITVCLNNIDGLKLARDSVKKQEFQGFEWIAIDGNSDDGSKEFLNSIKDEVTFTYQALIKGYMML